MARRKLRPVEIDEFAVGDIDGAYKWYLDQAQTEVTAERLLRRIRQAVNTIKLDPTSYRYFSRPYRKYRIGGRFQYLIVFRCLRTQVRVYALIHEKQDQKPWKKAIRQRHQLRQQQ